MTDVETAVSVTGHVTILTNDGALLLLMILLKKLT